MRASPDRRSDDLSEALLALASLPDDSAALPGHLSTIVRLSASVVGPVDYASVTVSDGRGDRTPASSSSVAEAVDAAQYSDEAGPCLLALRSGETVGVPDVVGAVVWPGFRDVAWRYGIRASLSIPLFAGSGVPVAGLNLYAREAAGMRLLIRRVQACYETSSTSARPLMDAGSEQLLAGLAGALQARDLVQRALGVLIERDNVPAGTAYRRLVEEAGSGGSLTGAATAILRQYAH
ncbi:GAF and ANTAR domain-containing protein [Micromonospora sp. NPDC000663]|uniref:GAF and ANTAR domain-containing protein n=1 Tax=Micromonospora sp. NPDC000663 TaxID=3364218 RepID=UPI0036780CA8